MTTYRIPGVAGVYDHERKVCRTVTQFEYLSANLRSEFIYQVQSWPVGVGPAVMPIGPGIAEEYRMENGELKSGKVAIKIFGSIEHGDLDKVSAIVLHRTDGSRASGTISAYSNGREYGAHFLVAEDGVIYQTANIKKMCWHVGNIRPRCMAEGKCSVDELKTINELLSAKDLSYSARIANVSNHEGKKSYPDRYPKNTDSIGIEVVGLFDEKSSSFSTLSAEQRMSTKWLVKVLASYLGLGRR
ncbi:MAG: N-acetylmuramoyl-L-alanine amidase [Thiobacillus sp.]|nr:N-acetylmuramoyl-L-alanine amidase [Thiobacillus sp.]